MFDAFEVSFRLRTTYRTNGIIYSLKSIPLIKKLLPSSLYASRELKLVIQVISLITEIISAFLGKGMYLLFLWIATHYMKAPAPDSFVHSLIFLTIIGGFTNTQMFNPTRDKYYAMFLMRMDVKLYTVVNYGYFLLKMLIGFIPFSFLFGLLCKTNILTCMLIPVYVVSVKLCISALYLVFSKKRKVINENRLSPMLWMALAVLFALAYVPPVFGFALNQLAFAVLVLVMIVPAVFATRYIIGYQYYKRIYKAILVPQNFSVQRNKEKIVASQQMAMQKVIQADPAKTSNKSGYKYFNELFMKRHAKLLMHSAKVVTWITVAVLAAVIAWCFLVPDIKQKINELMMTYLPYFLFVMYLMNRGKVITQAMFMNCDHSMLTYRFYRQPKTILMLFVERLKYIVLINLMPASVIAVGLPLLLYITGGTEEPLNYLILFVSIISMSVFFSVHNIVLYYLLQPYNINLEAKSATYNIISFLTYFVCYGLMGKKVPTMIFGTAVTSFCIVYIVVALILAYRLAPKTFKIRQ